MFVLCVLPLPYRRVISVYYTQCRCSSTCKISCTFEMNASLLSVFLSGNHYNLIFCFRKFITTFVSKDLQTFTYGHLLNLCMAIENWCSLFNFLWFILPKEQFDFFVPVPWVFFSRVHVSVVGILNSYPMPCTLHSFWFVFYLFRRVQPPNYLCRSGMSEIHCVPQLSSQFDWHTYSVVVKC